MSQYGIKPGYKARLEPEYFQDTMDDGLVWQPDAYKIAAYLARLMKRRLLYDIGCGRAHKLIDYGTEFRLLGIDTGENIQYCEDHYPEHVWVKDNLETTDMVISSGIARDSVIICADVIEHLANPSALLRTIQSGARYTPVILTTPDRVRMYGYDHDGPPTNSAHTREWTLLEMTTLLAAHNIPVTWAGYTASEDGTFHKNTMLLLLGLDAPYAQSVEQAFDVEVAR